MDLGIMVMVFALFALVPLGLLWDLWREVRGLRRDLVALLSPDPENPHPESSSAS